MNLTIDPRGVLIIDDARLMFRNFSGAGSMYNREGDRNFHLVIPDEEIKDILMDRGWNIRVKPPRDVDDSPLMTMMVKVKYTDKSGPYVKLISGQNSTELDAQSIGCLDKIDIDRVDLDIRPYDWDYNGKSGRTAYLSSIRVYQRMNRFAD